MDNRGYGSGYSSWGGGSSGSRGSGGFDMYGGGYKDSGLGGYGGGGHMKRGLSGGSMLSSSVPHADAVIAKINQRLDMLTQLEGGFRGPRGDRFDEYESFDSRSSGLSSSRDLYRSGGGSYGFGDGRGDNMLMSQRGGSGYGGGIGLGGGGGFDSPSSSYGVAKMRQNMRDSFASGQGGGSGGGGWVGAGRHSPRRGGSAGARGPGGGFGGRRSDPTSLSGGMRGSGGGGHSHRGHSPGGGRGKLPSLLSNRMYPESGGFQGSAPGPQDFPGRHFGGGPRGGRQRGRKRPLIKQQVKPQRDGQKKRKQTQSGADEPESKMNKTESEGNEATQEELKTEGADDNPETATGETTLSEEGKTATPKQEEKKKPALKPTPTQGQEKQQKARKRRGFMDRLMFACSVCKFRSFYKEEMDAHLESRFHKDHFKFLSSQLSKPTTDFLQEYMQNKFKKTAERVGQLENHSATICQIYREQDLTRELGMEHFMRKVEAAHCGACDLFIPMQPHLIQKHIKSPDHNYNRKGMMEQSKRGSLSVARSILNHKLIGKKLESYLKGENPFTGNQDDHDPEDSMAMDVSELELTGETAECQPENTEVKDESVAEGQPAEVAEGGEPAAAAVVGKEGEEKMEQEEELQQQQQQQKEEEEQQQQQKEEEEEQQQQEEEEEQQQQENQEDGEQENHGEEGFEVGEGEEEEEDDEGYVVHDEGDEGIHGEQEEA